MKTKWTMTCAALSAAVFLLVSACDDDPDTTPTTTTTTSSGFGGQGGGINLGGFGGEDLGACGSNFCMNLAKSQECFLCLLSTCNAESTDCQNDIPAGGSGNVGNVGGSTGGSGGSTGGSGGSTGGSVPMGGMGAGDPGCKTCSQYLNDPDDDPPFCTASASIINALVACACADESSEGACEQPDEEPQGGAGGE